MPYGNPTYAVTGWREEVGRDAGEASIVLHGWDTTKDRSETDVGWLLVQRTDPVFDVRPGDTLVIAEGSRVTARVFVDRVDPLE